jgi:hypothetical protein
LEGADCTALETEVGLEVLSDLTNETLEGKLSDEELGGLLVTADLTESDGTRLVSVGLLDTSGRWCGLASSLGSKLLTGGLATGRLRQLAFGQGLFVLKLKVTRADPQCMTARSQK